MTSVAMAAVLAIVACAHPQTDPYVHPENRGASHCDIEPGEACGAEALPHITDKDWSDTEFQRFFERSRKGTVAIEREGAKAKVMFDCRLEGSYLEIAGEPGGRLWATNRVLFLPGEIGADCARATHVVAAFAKSTSSRRFSAMLVPLPCPPDSDPNPAKGCLGRGLTGPERRARSHAMIERLRSDKDYIFPVVPLLEIYALNPDGYEGINTVSKLYGERTHDCALGSQALWVVNAYNTTEDPDGKRRVSPKKEKLERPRFHMAASERNCLYRPVFLSCFPGLFDPAPTGSACWQPAPEKTP